MIELKIPLEIEESELYINLENDDVYKAYSNTVNLEMDSNFLTQNLNDYYVTDKYNNKDISIEYVDNISIPSRSVPKNDSFRFIKKQSNSLSFVTTNPKKMEVYTSDLLSSLIDTEYLNGYGIISKFNRETKNLKVYTLPHGGLDKYDSWFFYVDSSKKIKNLKCKVDFILGELYVDTSDNQDILFVFALYNLVPLKVINKGNITVEGLSEDFYKLDNKLPNNYISVEYKEDYAILTTDQDIFITIPLESKQLLIDGVPVKKGQKLQIKSNEKLIVTKGDESSIKNHEYLSKNTEIFNKAINNQRQFNTSTIESFGDVFAKDYFISVYTTDFKNTINKEQNTIIKIY